MGSNKTIVRGLLICAAVLLLCGCGCFTRNECPTCAVDPTMIKKPDVPAEYLKSCAGRTNIIASAILPSDLLKIRQSDIDAQDECIKRHKMLVDAISPFVTKK